MSGIDIGNLKRTAYHEAGHAAVQIALREESWHEFHKVHIFPDNHRPGLPQTTYIDWKDRELQDLGLVEGNSIWNPKSPQGIDIRKMLEIQPDKAETKSLWLNSMCREVLILMAGPVAELHHMGRADNKADTVAGLLYFSDSDDIDQARAVIADYKALTGRAPLRKLATESVELVRSHWHQIDALAEALLDRKALTYEEAVAVVGVCPVGTESAWAPH